MNTPTEGEIQKTILDYLLLKGHLPIRFNNIPVTTHDGKKIPVRRKGVSDILVCLKTGKFAGIEVKRPGGKPTPEQTEFLEDVQKRGGLGIVASSVEDVQRAGI